MYIVIWLLEFMQIVAFTYQTQPTKKLNVFEPGEWEQKWEDDEDERQQQR